MIYLPSNPGYAVAPTLSFLDRAIFASVAAMTVLAVFAPAL